MVIRLRKITRKSPVLLTLVMILAAFMIIASKPMQSYGESIESSFTGRLSADPIATAIQSHTYAGKHSAWVRKLLTRVPGWQCPSNDEDSGKPPKVKAEMCMRDSYVAAAVMYAWAAECYARKEEDNKAEAAAQKMYENLESAQGFCSDSPTVGGSGGCDTMTIYRCGEL